MIHTKDVPTKTDMIDYYTSGKIVRQICQGLAGDNFIHVPLLMTTSDGLSSSTSSCLQGAFINNSYNRPIMNMATSSRFNVLNEDDINKLVSVKDRKNTVRVIKNSVQLFREFLSEKKMSPNFEELLPEDLKSHLTFFVASLTRKCQVSFRHSSTLRTFKIFETKM